MKDFVKLLILSEIFLYGNMILASEYERLYPKSGRRDTLIEIGTEFQSNHPNKIFFEDHEIIEIHQTLNQGVGLDSKNLYIQPSKQGCSIGVTKMLLADHQKDFSLINEQRKLGTINDIQRDLRNSGLRAKISSFQYSLDSLNISDLLGSLGHGSIILQILDDKIGLHFIIMDEVYQNKGEDLVRIRDPYHAWDISVRADSILTRIDSLKYIYIKN